MKNLLFVFPLLLILFQNAFSQAVEEDILYLKSGNIIRGVITEISADGSISIRTSKGYLRVYQLSEMDHLVKANKEALEEGERTVDSQTQKGTVSLRGAAHYSSIYAKGEFIRSYYNGQYHTAMENYEYSLFVFTPSAGFFVFDNFSANFAMNIENSQKENETADYISFGILLNYYFGVEPSKPFIAAGIQLSRENTYGDSFGYTFGAGYSFAIAKNVALQPMIQYFSNKLSNDSPGILHALTLGVGVETFIF